MEIFKFKSNLLSFLTLAFSKSPYNQAMLNPSSPNLDEVIGNVVEEVLRERIKEGNQETTLKVLPEEMEIEVKVGEARVFYSNKGEEAFKKHLAKKGYVEETKNCN